MAETIEQRAGKARLSSTEKLALDFILKNKRQACFLTSNEIAEVVGVSASSVVRLSKKLGFENYTTFKKVFQREQAEDGQNPGRVDVPYEKIKQYENLTDSALIAAFRQRVTENIRRDISNSEESRFVQAADLISNAKRVFVVGFRTGAGFASTFGMILSLIRPGVFIINNQQPIADFLIDLTPEDVMIVISFSRYSSSATFAIEMAKDAGCHVIAMTDSYASHVAQAAETVIISSVDNLSFFNSNVSFVMSMETIVLLVSKRNKKQNESRLIKMEKYLDETGQY